MSEAGSRGEDGKWRSGTKLKALSLVLLLCVAPGALSKGTGQSSGPSEYEVKAAFLFHFAEFVEWPSDAFPDTGSPLTYCTIGGDSFRGALDESVKGKNIGGRSLRIQHLREKEQIDGCQVLFIGGAENKRTGEQLARIGGRPVLTVGDAENFPEDGGIIGFRLEENKVRFEINLEAAGKARLKISAKLLSLAKKVIGNSRGN